MKPWHLFLGTWLATASAAREVAGDIGVGIVLMSALMGILTGVNGFMYASSRLLLAMARDRLLPQSLAEVHNKFRTPYKAVLLTYALSSIGPLFGREALLWFVNVASFGTAFAYLHVGFSTFKQFNDIALNSNRSKRYVKALGLASIAVSLIFLGLILYQLWLYYRFTALVAVIAYTLLGLILYSIRGVSVRK